jgi:hypothetical protein
MTNWEADASTRVRVLKSSLNLGRSTFEITKANQWTFKEWRPLRPIATLVTFYHCAGHPLTDRFNIRKCRHTRT